MASDGESACQLLARSAGLLFPIVMDCAMQLRERTAGEVFTLLGLIARETFKSYETDSDIEEVAESLLDALFTMCVANCPTQRRPATAQKIHDFIDKQEKKVLRECVKNSFERRQKSGTEVKELCDKFLAKLKEGDQPPSSRELSATKTPMPAPNDYPRHVSKSLFQILHQHAACRPLAIEAQGQEEGWVIEESGALYHTSRLHPARLHLDGTLQAASEHANFEIVFSGPEMSYWQDLWVGIPVQSKKRQRAIRFEDVSSDEDEDEDDEDLTNDQVAHNYFCEVLQQPSYARAQVQLVQGVGLVALHQWTPLERFLCPGQGLSLLQVLQEYSLTDKDKIILAHSIAHSFWQFYASDLMRTKWTSEDIWFMQETDDQHNAKDQLALRAYMPLNFGDAEATPEMLDDRRITHPYPHIFALGIILLEVGLRRPFKSLSNAPLISRLNFDHSTARQRLNELEGAKWTSTKHREKFTQAVASCLDPNNFTPLRKKSKRAKSASLIGKPTRTSSFQEPDIDHRRRCLYRNVVEPLSQLVNTAFKKDPRYVTYISKFKNAEQVHRNGHPQVAAFHAGRIVVPDEWLDNLASISDHIQEVQIKHDIGAIAPVKIAILDTGYDSTLPYFKKRTTKSRMRWKDFVQEEDTGDGASGQDGYGHGSLMARLVLESAPLAKVYVARVAADTRHLEKSRDNIVKAIKWAGIEEEVDIISMSFGFPHDDFKIARAIEDVERERDVIFMASSGNNAANQTETFPARHRSTICIRATDCDGRFLASNPPITNSSKLPVLGTYGDNLPDDIHDEITQRFGADICHPGSSIATAVAAGIAATTITYAELLCATMPYLKNERDGLVKSLKTREGMEKMLEKMSPELKSHRKFVNPVWLWSERAPEPLKAWVAMYDSVSHLMSQRE